MGIKDEFHQKAILSCVNELINPPEDTTNGGDQFTEYPSDEFSHNLTQHSFSTLERCEKCNKFLRGLLHQGFICQGSCFTTNSHVTVSFNFFKNIRLWTGCSSYMLRHRSAPLSGHCRSTIGGSI